MDIRPRLQKIVTMTPICDSVADIGTDHGYALISLLKENRIKSGIASDNKKKPLEKARRNATAEGVMDSITFRRGNGLETLTPGEVNGVIIAGMGGQLIKEILNFEGVSSRQISRVTGISANIIWEIANS